MCNEAGFLLVQELKPGCHKSLSIWCPHVAAVGNAALGDEAEPENVGITWQ